MKFADSQTRRGDGDDREQVRFQGRPMDGAMLLEVIETMPTDFDASGNILPTNKFLTHPEHDADL